jgi:LemA protein
MDASLLIIIAVGLFVVFAIIQYNRLVRLNVQIDEAFAQIEVQLKRRADLIPNLVETVKGYASHEREALEKVVQARAASTTASTLPAVAEAYPDLKASTNFLQLQEELSTTENKVSFSRQFYNDSVRTLNVAVKTIPTSFFVGLAKVGEREFYEVEDPTIRNAPNVKF